MGLIRKVKESDYGFIYNSMKDYPFEISRNYEKYFIKILIENKYSLTYVYEEDGEAKAYHSVMTHPKSFIASFYQQMPFFKKIGYMIKSQINNLSSGEKKFDHIPMEYRKMIEHIYDYDDNYIVSISAYSNSKTIILNHLAIYTYRKLVDKYKWSIGMIRKDNKVALLSNKMLYGASIRLFDIDKEIMCDVVDIKIFVEQTSDFKTHHELLI